jgi:hypothetical protein
MSQRQVVSGVSVIHGLGLNPPPGGAAATQQPPRTITRAAKDRARPYTIINNTVFNGRGLNRKAKGLAGYFLSKPDDWRISVTDLVAWGGDGAKAVYSGLRELVAADYVHRSALRDAAGRFRCWEYVVYEAPQPLRQNGEVDGPLGDQASHPHAGSRHAGNATQPDNDPDQVLRDNKQRTEASGEPAGLEGPRPEARREGRRGDRADAGRAGAR